MKRRLGLLCILTLLLVPLAPLPALGAPAAPAPAAPTLAQPGPGTAPADRAAQPSAFDPLFGVMSPHSHAPGTPAHGHGAATSGLVAAPAASQAQPVKNDELCPGANLIELPQSDRCTHGPDPAPPGLSIGREVAPVSPAEAAASATPRANCVGNGSDGNRVQVLYARANDVTSRYSTFLPSFRAWADDANLIFQESAAETGGTRAVRYVHDSFCNVIIPEVVLSANGDDTFDNTVAQLAALGWNRTDRKYMIFMDATVLCGIGHIWNNDSSATSNRNNIGPDYGRTDAGCWGGEVAAHELMHNLGGVQLSAPNDSGGWHCVDEWDRMCYSDSPNFPTMVISCADGAHDRLFDCNHDDYYHTNPPAGNYLATHWNPANNSFLAGGIAPPVCPDRALESDSSAAEARAYNTVRGLKHAFCSTNDTDWVYVNATASNQYRIETHNLAAGVDTVLEVFASDGTTSLAINDDRVPGDLSSLITFDATTTGRFYVQVSDFNGTPGSHVFEYDLTITQTVTDTTPPTTPALNVVEAPNTPNQYVAGDTLYYRPVAGQSGSFRVTATTTDPQSGVKFVTFPTLFGAGGNDTAAPYQQTYAWSGATVVSGNKPVTATNNVNRRSAASVFTVTPDTVKPTLAITAPAAGARITAPSVVIRANASDAGAGIASVLFRRCQGGACVTIGTDTTVAGGAQYSVTWNTGAVPAGTYAIQAVATDNVGNVTTVSRNVVVE